MPVERGASTGTGRRLSGFTHFRVHGAGAGYPRRMTPDDADRDSPAPDAAVLESAMDTGSEDGEPGDRPDDGPLDDDERALLDRLTHDDRPNVVTGAPEDSPAVARAVADGTVVPDEP